MLWHQQSLEIDLDIAPTIMLMGKGAIGRGPVDRYNLPGVWCLHLYSGQGEVEIDGVAYPIQPGYASIMPPGVDNAYRAPKRFDALYVHFTLTTGRGRRLVRVMQDTGDRFNDLWSNLETAIAYRGSIPRRSDVIVWDILWQLALSEHQMGPSLADSPWSSAGRPHFGLRAMQLIEYRLAERLSVESLACELDISHSTLTRTIKAITGDTVIRYILKRRVERAQLLLRYSPKTIGEVARDVGIPDMQQFNKTIRRFLGASPTQLRAARYDDNLRGS